MNRRNAALILAGALTLTPVSCASEVGTASTDTPPATAETTAAVSTETAAPTENTQPAEQTTAAPVITDSEDIIKGSIYDSRGNLLSYTYQEADGTLRRHYADKYSISFANIITEMSAGYDTTFNDILTEKNPTPVGGADNYGQSLRLTIDGDIQNMIYTYMEQQNIVGSVVVLRTDGSILSQVSYPSYDPSTVAKQEYDEELAWGECGNKAFQNYEPGSCFKIMSEVIADKHGVNVLYDEGTWEVGGVPIVNWDHDTNTGYPVAERTLYSAFVNSSNIFFAKAFDQIGAEAVLDDLNTIFHFGADNDIECDFGNISNNIEIYCDDDLRRSAFGQSYVLTCPIFLAALGREAAFGDMVTPFVVDEIVDSGDVNSVISDGTQPSQVIASIPEEYRENLRNGMSGVASGLGVYVPDGYSFYAKTGTAETWVNDFLYITGCVKKDTDDGSAVYDGYEDYSDSYVIVMQVQNPDDHGFEFASQSSQLYRGIVDIVVS